jgi:hypothetical protein
MNPSYILSAMAGVLCLVVALAVTTTIKHMTSQSTGTALVQQSKAPRGG